MNDKVEMMSAKAMLLSGLYVPLVLFFNQFHKQLIILCIFILVDLFFGIAKSLKLHEKITYEKLWSGLMAKAVTIMIPFLLYFFTEGLGNYHEQLKSILPTTFSLLIIAEFYSVISNGYMIMTGEKVANKDLVSWTVRGLREKIETLVTKGKGKDE